MSKKIMDEVFGFEVSIDSIEKGDLVDFGSYGKSYVVGPNHSENNFWVTKDRNKRFKSDARGWTIRKDLAEAIVERGEDYKPITEDLI